MFANQYLAYETLSDGMKKMLAGMRAVHSDILVAGPQAGKNKGRSTKHATARTGARRAASIRWCAPIPRPAARCCSSTRPIPCGFDGMTEAESRPLLDFLLDAWQPAGIHLPLPLAEGLDRLLGQPQHQAHRAGRHRAVPPAAAPGPDLRRKPV